MTSIRTAVSHANEILPALLAHAHAHDLTGEKHFTPCTFDVDGARRALHFVDRVAPHVQNQATTLAHIRGEIVAALVAEKADATPHHPHAARHALEEFCARAARAIRARVDTVHCSAPPAYARPVVDGVERAVSAHDGFDDARARTDVSYLRAWLVSMSDEEAKRDDQHRARAWLALAAELQTHAKAA